MKTNLTSLPARHVLSQGKVAATLGNTVVQALLQRVRPQPQRVPVVPGPEFTATVPPLPRALVRDYVRHVGGDPSAYARTVPPHLFPQWTFPLAARTLEGLPYPLLKIVNGGCRLTVNAPLPAGEPLLVRARLEGIDDDGHRAVLHQRLVSGTAAQPDAVVADLYAIVPSVRAANGHANGKSNGATNGHANGANGVRRKPTPTVPAGARELAFWKLGPDAGLAFAMLTGDFNPIHWVPPYARAFGFRGAVLHGFATLARAMEGLHRGLYSGAVNRIGVIDVRFTRPLLLPARVGLYVGDGQIAVGDAAGGPAYLTGHVEEHGS